MSKRVLLINGPPRAGKDTLADYVIAAAQRKGISATKAKFADPLTSAITAMLGLPETMLEAMKDEPLFPDTGYGSTYRHIKQRLSEKVMKPLFGDDIFGRLLVQRINAHPAKFFVVSDSGFEAEAVPVVAAVGTLRISLVQVHRIGSTFTHDTRDWLSGTALGIGQFAAVDNNDEPIDLAKHAKFIVDSIFGE